MLCESLPMLSGEAAWTMRRWCSLPTGEAGEEKSSSKRFNGELPCTAILNKRAAAAPKLGYFWLPNCLPPCPCPGFAGSYRLLLQCTAMQEATLTCAAAWPPTFGSCRCGCASCRYSWVVPVPSQLPVCGRHGANSLVHQLAAAARATPTLSTNSPPWRAVGCD